MTSLVIQHRVLAGIRFVDISTGAQIRAPLSLRGLPGGVSVSSYANHRHIHVIAGVEGLEAHAASFEQAPAAPPPQSISVTLEVRDPAGVYLPRQFTIDLPRSDDPEAANPVHEPIEVSLLRSPRATKSRNWAMIRVHLTTQGASDDPVPAALLRVVQDPDGDREILGWGMSVVADPEAREIERQHDTGARWVHFDTRHVGEASVPVVGLSSQVWGVADDEPVLLTDIAATLEVIPMTVAAPGRLPDPDAFFDAPVSPDNTRDLELSVGGELHTEPFPVTIA